MLKFTCCNAVQALGCKEKSSLLTGIKRGIERETLRVTGNGELAQTPHPLSLGSKLTHPFITTDYAEALLEFITPASSEFSQPLEFLTKIHQFVARRIGDELMWSTSMPCMLGDENLIQIADYGSSNSGKMKYVYREGLGHRYGRQMQTIAGVHYNWSLPEEFWQWLQQSCGHKGSLRSFKDERYFALIRNYQRYSWLIPYLFGASPAVCRSFLKDGKLELKELSPRSLYGEYATSLRMSDIGYQNNAQAGINIRFDNLNSYLDGMEHAIRTPDPYYENIGVVVDGHWKQLNGNLLQVENEFYSGIRPKHTPVLGMRPSKSLRLHGVEYIEVRLFDIDAFSPIGINEDMMRFADVLLLMCLFRESPPISPREDAENKENKRRVVLNGRHPELSLLVYNKEQPFKDVALELFDDMKAFADLLDTAYGGKAYQQSLSDLRERVLDPEKTPSARLLREAMEVGGFFRYALGLAKQHRDTILSLPVDEVFERRAEQLAIESLADQKAMEMGDTLTFAEYVDRYYA